MNKYTGRPGALSHYIPGIEEIADDFIKLCNDHLLDENNDTPDNFVKELRPWGLECINYLFLGSRLGVSNTQFYLISGSKPQFSFRNLQLKQSMTKAETVIEL